MSRSRFSILAAVLSVCFAGTAASAAPKNLQLVFEVEGTLIQAIPEANRGQFPAEDVLQVPGVGKTYLVYPQAREIISQLHKQYPDLSISFASLIDRERLAKILDALKLTDGTGKTFKDIATSILSRENDVDAFAGDAAHAPWDLNLRYRLPLSALTRKAGETAVFVSPWEAKATLQPGDSVFDLGENYFQFPTFAAATAALDASSKGDAARHENWKRYFPTEEGAWKRERDKLLEFYVAIAEAFEAKPAVADPMAVALAAFAKHPASAVGYGRRLVAGLDPIGPQWKIEGGKIVGCSRYDYRAGKALSDYPSTKACLDALPIRARWEFATAEKLAVRSCLADDADSGLAIGAVGFERCVAVLHPDALWTGQVHQGCAYYTSAEHAFVQAAPTAACASDRHFLRDPELKVSYVFEHFAGLEGLSPSALLAHVRIPPPDAAHLDRLWYPNDRVDSIPFDFAGCQDGYKHTMRLGADGTPLRQCVPDTVYSFGPKVKLDNLLQWIGDGAWVQKLSHTLWGTRSPMATHGYGPIPIRVKFRPDVKWKTGYCSGESNTVAYGGSTLFDVTICSTDAIESWSYGLKEHYDEIVKEYKWLKDPRCNLGNCDLYDMNNTSVFDTGWDGHDFTESTFLQMLGNMFETARDGKGRLFCNPSLPKNLCTTERHFATSRPIYYNDH